MSTLVTLPPREQLWLPISAATGDQWLTTVLYQALAPYQGLDVVPLEVVCAVAMGELHIASQAPSYVGLSSVRQRDEAIFAALLGHDGARKAKAIYRSTNPTALGIAARDRMAMWKERDDDPNVVWLDISGQLRADVLAALINAAPQKGGGKFSRSIDRTRAQFLLEGTQPIHVLTATEKGRYTSVPMASLYVMERFGRLLWIDLSRPGKLDVTRYDITHGRGHAAAAIHELRTTGNVNSPGIQALHRAQDLVL